MEEEEEEDSDANCSDLESGPPDPDYCEQSLGSGLSIDAKSSCCNSSITNDLYDEEESYEEEVVSDFDEEE